MISFCVIEWCQLCFQAKAKAIADIGCVDTLHMIIVKVPVCGHCFVKSLK